MNKFEERLHKLGYSLALRYEDAEYWGGVRFSIRFSFDGIEFISKEPNNYVKATPDELLAFVDYWNDTWGDV